VFRACVAGAGGWMALRGNLTVGELAIVVGLAQFLVEPVQGIGMAGQMFATARASAQRLVRLLDAPDAVTPGDRLLPSVLPDAVAAVELHEATHRKIGRAHV